MKNPSRILVTLAGAGALLASAGCAAREARSCEPVNHWGAPVFRCAEDSAADDTAAIVVEETATPAKPAYAVILRKDRIEILQKVQFDTGAATVLPESFALLDEVAQTIEDHPEIAKVRIEGHTDSTGAAAFNERLSQERAEAVRDHLVKHGVEPERLEAKGFGMSQPIADNDTDEGREKNRRVEFKIISK